MLSLRMVIMHFKIKKIAYAHLFECRLLLLFNQIIIFMNQVAEISISYSSMNHFKQKVSSSLDAYNLLLNCWSVNTIEIQEEFKILLLNNSNEVLGIYPMSKGGITGTVVDLRLIFAVVLKCNATGILLAHNHPSGKLKPSEADISITKKIKSVASIMDICLLDHLIITKNGYYSFIDEGILQTLATSYTNE